MLENMRETSKSNFVVGSTSVEVLDNRNIRAKMQWSGHVE